METMKLPIAVTYRIIDGAPVAIEKEYADIPADEMARILLKEFKRQQKEKECETCNMQMYQNN